MPPADPSTQGRLTRCATGPCDPCQGLSASDRAHANGPARSEAYLLKVRQQPERSKVVGVKEKGGFCESQAFGVSSVN